MAYTRLSDSKRKRAIYIGSFGLLLLLCLKSCQHDGQQHKNHFYPAKKELSILGYIGLDYPLSLLWKTPTEARSRLPESAIGEKSSPEFSFLALVERSITPFASLFDSLPKKFWWPTAEGLKGTSSNFKAPLSIAGNEGPRSRVVNNVRGHAYPVQGGMVRGDVGRRAPLHPIFGHAGPVMAPTFGTVPPALLAPVHVPPVAMQATRGQIAVVNPQQGIFHPDSSQQLLGSPRIEFVAPNSSAPTLLASNQVNVTQKGQQADLNNTSTTSSNGILSDPEIADLLKKNYIPIDFKGGMGGKDLPGSRKRDDEPGSSGAAVLANNQVIIVQKTQQANEKTTSPSTSSKASLPNPKGMDLLKTKSPFVNVTTGENAKQGTTNASPEKGIKTDPNTAPLFTNKAVGVSVTTNEKGYAFITDPQDADKKQMPSPTSSKGIESEANTPQLFPKGNITVPAVVPVPVAKDLTIDNTLSPSLQATIDTDPVTQKGTLAPDDASPPLIKAEVNLGIPLTNLMTAKVGETNSPSSKGNESNPTDTSLFTNKGVGVSVTEHEEGHAIIIDNLAKAAENKEVPSPIPSNGAESNAKTSKTLPLSSIPVIVITNQKSGIDILETPSALKLTAQNTLSPSFQAINDTDPIKQTGTPVADNSAQTLLDNKTNVNFSIFQNVSTANTESGKITPLPSMHGSSSVTENSTPLSNNVVTPEGLLTSLQTQETPISATANTTQISTSPSSKGSENQAETSSQHSNHFKTPIENLLTTEKKVASEATTNEVSSSNPSVAQVSTDEHKDQLIKISDLKNLFDTLINAVNKVNLIEEKIATFTDVLSSQPSIGKRTSVSLSPGIQQGYQTLAHALANLLRTTLSTGNDGGNSNGSLPPSKIAMNTEPKQTLLNAGRAVNEAVQQLVKASKNIPSAQKMVEKYEKAAQKTVKLVTDAQDFQTLSPAIQKKIATNLQNLVTFYENFQNGIVNEDPLNSALTVMTSVSSPTQNVTNIEDKQKNENITLLSSLVNKTGTKLQSTFNNVNDGYAKLQVKLLKKSATFAGDSKPSPKDVELAKDLVDDLLLNLSPQANLNASQQIPQQESLNPNKKISWKQNKRWTIPSACAEDIKKQVQKQQKLPLSGRSSHDDFLPKGVAVF